MLGNNRRTGVAQMNTINPITSEVIEHTNYNDIEHTHIQYLPGLFLYADDPLLRSSPSLNDFGYTGDAIAGDEITARTYVPLPDTDEYTKLFLKCIQCPKHVPDATVSNYFTTEDDVTRWKYRREKISSSYSG